MRKRWTLRGCHADGDAYRRWEMAFTPDCRNTNSLWCSILAETLARLGVRHAVCSPGSRSTPLTFALANHPQIEAIPVLDERSAGFFALGLAKRTGVPTVLVCTSGSAAANYLPAIVEAHEAGVPLLVLTADRPPELRGCTSGQTIDQQKIFGAYVLEYHEMAVPGATLGLLEYLRQTLVHAYTVATGIPAGPVHLNCPFRDPLAPLEEVGFDATTLPTIDEPFFAHLNEPATLPRASAEIRWPTERGLIVAGNYQPADDRAYLAAVSRLASELRWPILAEAISPARRLAEDPQVTVVTAYDTILRNPRLASALVPAKVLCLGQWPTSKVLRSWLEANRVETVMVSPGPVNRDALHGRTRHLPLEPEGLAAAGGAKRSGDYGQLWADAEGRAVSALEACIQKSTTFVEPAVLWMLTRQLPADWALMVGNSMPVRDSEYFGARRAGGPRVWCNRGANGIDGNLSTALGLAHRGRPLWFVTGDLAFLHDATAFLSRPHFSGSLTVVVINNNGGGIFEHLPVAAFQPTFETFFATPQEADIEALCRAHRVAHRRLRSLAELEGLVGEPAPSGIRVLEVATNRKTDAAFRKGLFADVAASLA